MKKFIAIALIAAIAATSAISLAACGKDDKSKDAQAETQASSQAATQAPAKATEAAKQGNNASSNSGSADADTSDNGGSDGSVEYAGITQEKAMASALERCGDGAQVISCTQGTIPSGSQAGGEAWVVVVQEADGTQRSYYCGFPFCYNIENKDYENKTASEEYAGITEDQAISLAQERGGEGAEVTSCSQGTIPSGSQAGGEAWVLTVVLADGTEKTYYAGFPFIYDGDEL